MPLFKRRLLTKATVSFVAKLFADMVFAFQLFPTFQATHVHAGRIGLVAVRRAALLITLMFAAGSQGRAGLMTANGINAGQFFAAFQLEALNRLKVVQLFARHLSLGRSAATGHRLHLQTLARTQMAFRCANMSTNHGFPTHLVAGGDRIGTRGAGSGFQPRLAARTGGYAIDTGFARIAISQVTDFLT
jgi:hypothetical protein